MKEITELFEKKLKPAITGALKTRDAIVAQRKQTEADRQAFNNKIKQASDEIEKLEKAVDEKIVAGKSADDILQKIGTKQAEKAAYERHIQRLTDSDIEAASAEESANKALSVAIGKQLEALRMDIENMVVENLQSVLETLILFEHEAHETERACGVDMPKDRALSVFRFLGLYEYFKSLGAFLEPCGEDMSAIRRREALELWAARRREAEKAA